MLNLTTDYPEDVAVSEHPSNEITPFGPPCDGDEGSGEGATNTTEGFSLNYNSHDKR
jgi:hypothetical protein